jgi:hypothetical protein
MADLQALVALLVGALVELEGFSQLLVVVDEHDFAAPARARRDVVFLAAVGAALSHSEVGTPAYIRHLTSTQPIITFRRP